MFLNRNDSSGTAWAVPVSVWASEVLGKFRALHSFDDNGLPGENSLRRDFQGAGARGPATSQVVRLTILLR